MRRKQNMKKSVALLLALVISLMIFSGCSRENKDAENSKASSEENKVNEINEKSSDEPIVIWLFADTHAKYFEWVTEEYSTLHPEVSFDIQVMEYSALYDKLAVVIKSGGEGAPDLIDVEQGVFSRYMSKEMMQFVPLNEYIERDNILDKVVEGRMGLYRYNDKYYGLEHALCPVTMAYRTDMFEDNGIKVPETWDEYKEAAEQFKELGIYMASTSDMRTNANPDVYSSILRTAGLDYIDEDGNIIITDEFKEIISDYKYMQNNGMMYPYENDADRWTPFVEDKVATFFVADWAAGWLKDNVPEQEDKWHLTYLPKLTPDSSRVSCLGGTGFAMMTYTNHDKETLWDFMKFAQVDKDNAVKKFETINLFPVVYDAMDETNGPVDYFNDQNLGLLYKELAPEMPVQTQAIWKSHFIDVFTTHAYDFMEDNISVDEFTDILVKEVQEYIDSAQ